MYRNEIDKVNDFLKDQLWMDFEMCNINRGKLELHGFLDEAEDDKIIIIFEQPHMVSCNFFFTYEGKGNFLSIVEGKEAFQINKMYGVTQGNNVFKITNINVETDMIIIAKKVEVQIIEWVEIAHVRGGENPRGGSCTGPAENEERDTGRQWEAGLKHVAGREAPTVSEVINYPKIFRICILPRTNSIYVLLKKNANRRLFLENIGRASYQWLKRIINNADTGTVIGAL